MLPAEKIRVLLFVTAVFSVYAATLLIAGEYFYRRVTHKATVDGRSFVWSRRVVLGLAALGILCFLYGSFIEPYWLEVTRVRIESLKIPKGARPIHVVHISDLHSDPKPRLEECLPEVIAREKPDLIVFTGDALNSTGGLPVLKRCLTRLADVAPTFVVKGNWDVARERELDLFGNTGVRELEREAVKVRVEGTELWLAGVPAGSPHLIDKALEAVPSGAFTVFLYHYPDEILEVARRKVDLYCAGHTHGGQVALPFYGALMTLSRFGTQYEAGLYRADETWLYVNRGIGMEGDPAPRVRFVAGQHLSEIDDSHQALLFGNLRLSPDHPKAEIIAEEGCENGESPSGFVTPGNSRVEWVVFP